MIIDQAKLDELKALAEKARPGRFGLAECSSSGDAWLTLNLEKAEAKYVIAFTPQVGLSLIAEIERLRAELTQHAAECPLTPLREYAAKLKAKGLLDDH